MPMYVFAFVSMVDFEIVVVGAGLSTLKVDVVERGRESHLIHVRMLQSAAL